MSGNPWPQVVLFGDSLTQRSFGEDGGWGSVIADKLQRRCDVVNRGFSGYNSRWCRMLLPQLFTTDNVRDVMAFTIFLGANDSNDPEKNIQQHVPLAEYKDNMIKMVKYLNSIGINSEKIILIGPPPCNATACGLDNEVTGQYAAACRQVAKECGVSIVDLYLKLQEDDDWTRYFIDGLHFATSGAKAVGELVWPEIDARVQHLPPTIYPAWEEIDHEKPENTFQ